MNWEWKEEKKGNLPKTQTNMKDVDFTFWNEKITKPPRMNVMYSFSIDFYSQMMMKFLNI